MLPLVLCRLLYSGASISPPLVAPPHLVMPYFLFSSALASCLPRLLIVSPLVTPQPPVHLCLHLSLHRRHSLRPSHISCPAGFCIASHYVNASCLPTPPTLVAILPLVAPLSCLSSTLAGCCVARDVVQYGLITSRHCKDLQAKMNHPFVRVLGGPD